MIDSHNTFFYTEMYDKYEYFGDAGLLAAGRGNSPPPGKEAL